MYSKSVDSFIIVLHCLAELGSYKLFKDKDKMMHNRIVEP